MPCVVDEIRFDGPRRVAKVVRLTPIGTSYRVYGALMEISAETLLSALQRARKTTER